MSKYLINSIGLALIAAGQSMVASAADIPDLSGAMILGDSTGTAPATSASTAPLNPAAIANAELDNSGLPWDERIHASTKTKTQAGAWTKRKGVDDTTSAAIIRQLREKYPAPAAATTGTAALPGMPTGAATPPALGLPGMSLPMATPYQELCNWLAANTGEGKVLTGEWVGQQFASANTTLADLAAADAGLLKQWLDAFKGVLAQMGQ